VGFNLRVRHIIYSISVSQVVVSGFFQSHERIPRPRGMYMIVFEVDGVCEVVGICGVG